jgi:predicted permease
MAQQLGGDADYAAAQVVLTTAFSGVTVFLWIFAFKALGMVG